jgi:formylmethanofuran dehydrogenase subunit D
MKSIEVTLITGRTVEQGIVLEKKLEGNYTKKVAVCGLCKEDMETAGIKDGDVIRVSTHVGEVCVFAKVSEQLSKGLAFIPLGPWANAIVPTGTDSIGMPSFKGIKATIELAKGEKVLEAKELIRRYIHEG